MVVMTSLVVPSRGKDRASPGPAADDWQSVLREAIRDPAELCRALELPEEMAADLATQAAAEGFAVLVPRPFLARIRPGDPKDPLLRQVLPQAIELRAAPGYSRDPVGNAQATPYPGLLCKYPGRSLILTTGQCGVHCRFCFRRHFDFRDVPQTLEAWEPAMRRLAADSSIHEVIFSGGDPLTLEDEQLAGMLERLSQISHLRRVRVHSRLPVVIPQRITPALFSVLRSTRLTPWMVVHVNHPAEIDANVAAAITKIVESGMPVLSQTVLLKGVNDRVEVLAELFEKLIDVRVTPYYLHHLDPVLGAAHFEMSITKGKAIMAQLRRRLPGYGLPRYVRETIGGECKETLG